MLSAGTLLQGRYRIERELKPGGMGMLYVAHDERLGTTVALKQIKDEYFNDEKLLKQFEREARLLARLRHPGLARVTDHFADAGGQFLVMDYIGGRDLSDILRERHAPLPVADVLAWANQLLDALEYMHGQTPPVVHRDIKPQNIMLTPDNRVILLDFGLAKGHLPGHLSYVHSSVSVLGYTENYAPLEQINAETQGTHTEPCSDLFSLAATLFHLLTNAAPPKAVLRVAATADGYADPLPLISERNPQVTPAVAEVIRRALSIGRNGRQADAATLRAELKAAVGNTTEQFAPTILDAPQDDEATRLRQAETERERQQRAAEEQTRRPQNPALVIDLPQTLVAAPPVLAATPAAAVNKKRGNKRLWLVVGGVVASFVVGVIFLALINVFNRGESISSGNTTPTIPKPAPTTQPRSTPTPPPRTIRNAATGMEFVYVPAGNFQMGSDKNDDEKPVHRVTLNYGFYMGKYEVTQAQYAAVMGTNPSKFSGCDNCPVEQVSWNDAQEFIRKLNVQDDSYVYRLPSEAEWEYACRAGTTMAFAFGDSLSSNQANFNGDYQYSVVARGVNRKKTVPVGSFQPNGFGLYDMHGNVEEWVADIYNSDGYAGLPSDGSANISVGDSTLRVLRGGSWVGFGEDLRSAIRSIGAPGGRGDALGFRMVAFIRT